MATADETVVDPANAQPIVMTREQFNQLKRLIASNHADSRVVNTFTTYSMLPLVCSRDGLIPKHVTVWIRALDGRPRGLGISQVDPVRDLWKR